MNRKYLLLFLLFIIMPVITMSQDAPDLSKITGNIQTDVQYYIKDKTIDTKDVPEKIRTNNYYYFTYSLGGFTAGLRYEAYMNEILGYEGYRGNGIANRFLSYTSDLFDATFGNFYEQYGSGILLRSYEERQLAWDNSIDGVNVRFRPTKGIELKGLVGKMRDFWKYGNGLMRGGDASVSVLQLFPDYKGPLNFTVGGTAVSKYEPDQSATLKLPQNVMAYSGRFSLSGDVFSVDGEIAHKINDPEANNEYFYNAGNAIVVNASYYPSSLGIGIHFHRFDNMDFRSDRGANGKELIINYLPTLTKQHTYALANIYPYATQPNGEIGVQAELTYTFPEESFFGGDHPLQLSLNYSRIQNLDTTRNDIYTYNSSFPGIGKELLYQDANIELTKKWSRVFETSFSYVLLVANREIIENHPGHFGMVTANIQAIEGLYRLASRTSVRLELQNMIAKQSKPFYAEDNGDQTNGNWAMLLAELTIAPSWYLSGYDQWNYGNNNPDLRVNYPNLAVAYVYNSLRVSLGFGRQRQGLLCVGGICRQVPSANGVTLSITNSF